MSDLCKKCRNDAKTTCTKCGGWFCYTHLTTMADRLELICKDCREERTCHDKLRE